MNAGLIVDHPNPVRASTTPKQVLFSMASTSECRITLHVRVLFATECRYHLQLKVGPIIYN